MSINKVQIKVVPNDKPNSAGEWITVQLAAYNSYHPRSWLRTEETYSIHVPEGYHMVAIGKADAA